ncbi:MAG: lysophospholipase [Actinobacteria bacterium]|nr:lysophospholipase [Actinomycetota bacterium]
MKQSLFQWTTRDGLQLQAREWAHAAKDPRAVVCLVHGYAEHSARYGHMAAELTRSGFILMTFDLRGHGRSGGKRGHTPSYEAMMDDISLLLDEAARRYPGLPRFLYGHSMGGNLALNYTLRRQPDILGVVASSPWLRLTRQPPGIMVLLARIMNKITPSATLKIKLDASGLSHDQEVVRAYINDPYVLNEISFRLFTGIYDSGRWAMDYAYMFPLPLLILHGDSDPVTSPEASKQFAATVPGECTLKIWKGLLHETHNELQKQEVITYVKGWLESNL